MDKVFGNSDLRNLILWNRRILMLKFLKKRNENIIKNDMTYRVARNFGIYGWCEQSFRTFGNNPDLEIEWVRESGDPSEHNPECHRRIWNGEDWV